MRLQTVLTQPTSLLFLTLSVCQLAYGFPTTTELFSTVDDVIQSQTPEPVFDSDKNGEISIENNVITTTEAMKSDSDDEAVTEIYTSGEEKSNASDEDVNVNKEDSSESHEDVTEPTTTQISNTIDEESHKSVSTTTQVAPEQVNEEQDPDQLITTTEIIAELDATTSMPTTHQNESSEKSNNEYDSTTPSPQIPNSKKQVISELLDLIEPKVQSSHADSSQEVEKSSTENTVDKQEVDYTNKQPVVEEPFVKKTTYVSCGTCNVETKEPEADHTQINVVTEVSVQRRSKSLSKLSKVYYIGSKYSIKKFSPDYWIYFKNSAKFH